MGRAIGPPTCPPTSTGAGTAGSPRGWTGVGAGGGRGRRPPDAPVRSTDVRSVVEKPRRQGPLRFRNDTTRRGPCRPRCLVRRYVPAVQLPGDRTGRGAGARGTGV